MAVTDSSFTSPRVRDSLAAIHQRTLELIVHGASLQDVLGALCDGIDGLDPDVSGPNVAKAQITAFREWERVTGERFADLRGVRHPTLVVQGFHDEMIPVRNSYWLAENLPNAVLLVYPDAGHGSLFQYPEAFTRHAAAFLSSDSESAAF